MVDELKKELEVVNKKIKDFSQEFLMYDDDSDKKSLNMLNNKFIILTELKSFLTEKIFYLERNIIISDDEIELVEYNDKYLYRIYLYGIDEFIGTIEYREGYQEYIGNIGYSILESYRGHNYAKKAFNLLNKILYEDGIEKFYVTAKKNNIASIKTIKNVGGIQVEDDASDVLKFEVKLKR